MNAAHKQALADGRARATSHKRELAVGRVVRYEHWLKTGSVLRDIPPIPSDADYRMARDAAR